MSASCLCSPTIGGAQTERRMDARGLFSHKKHVELRSMCSPAPESPPLTPSTHSPTPKGPSIPSFHLAAPSSLHLRSSCSDRTKTSGRAEERQGRMWKEARGEQKELRTTGRNATCTNPATDSCLRCAAKGRRGHAALRGCTAEASDQVLQNSWRRVETFECHHQADLKTQAASERVKLVADIEFYMLDCFRKFSPD